MLSFKVYNDLLDKVYNDLKFTDKRNKQYKNIEACYEALIGYDEKRAYNLQKRLKNSKRIKSYDLLLDTVRNTPSFIY